MKHHLHTHITTRLCAVIAALVLGGSFSMPSHAFASGGKAAGGGATGGGGGSTTTTTTTSSGGGGGGGGGGGSNSNSTSTTSEPVSQAGKNGGSSGTVSTTTTTTTTTQVPVTGTLTCSSSITIGGVVPQGACTYSVDPYYPTLSFMTLHLDCNNINDVDGSYYFVTISTANNVYTVPGSSLSIVGGAGSCVISAYVQPGATVTGVTVTDINGQVILSGN